jgi:eukaryotic-like serine/threonine-protein kinase
MTSQQLRAPTDPVLGSVLLGRYRVVRELAKGGMGVVYLARAEGAVGFVKPVVIKLLLPEHAQDERFVGMFVREAKILSQLRHPSVVDVIEFGEQDGAYVLVMEYVRGYHLGQWLRYLAVKKRQAPPAILIQIAIDVLEALHHAHELKHPDGTSMHIVHRDVSPSNILLDEDGRARLLDFGVARMRGGSQDYKTQVAGFMGKMPYTAPELFTNAEASPKSDLYACGVVLHEALLGRNVFRAEAQAATLHKVMNHVPELVEPLVPNTPSGLDVALGRALMKSLDDRHETARDFALALRRLQREQESDIRRSLAEILKVDFGPEMAEKLNIESLAHRDEAWRRLSVVPERVEPQAARGERSVAQLRTQEESLAVPPAAGATVAHSPASRRLTPGYILAPQLPEFTPSAPQTTASMRRAAQAQAAERPRSAAEVMPSLPTVAANVNAAPQPLAAATPSPVGFSRGVVFGLCAVACLATAAIVLVLVRPSEPPTTAVPIRVVSTSNQQPSVTTVAPPPTAATQSAAPAPAPAMPADKPKPEKGKRGAEAQGLTLALRRQQAKLEGCFRQHSVELEGQPTMQLEFDLEASGAIKRVGISPKALAKTSLGECLLTVGERTKFPQQASAVSFAIPLTARRSAGSTAE